VDLRLFDGWCRCNRMTEPAGVEVSSLSSGLLFF
jgi:hypothetical protein